jgi:hypothetical protein
MASRPTVRTVSVIIHVINFPNFLKFFEVFNDSISWNNWNRVLTAFICSSVMKSVNFIIRVGVAVTRFNIEWHISVTGCSKMCMMDLWNHSFSSQPTEHCFILVAFDSVNHGILLNKLQFYGIDGKFHDLITSYLSDRSESFNIKHQLELRWYL